MPSPHQPLRHALVGTLVRDAEVLNAESGGLLFVVELAHTPPIVAVERYLPGAPSATYIAAKERAQHFKAGCLAMVTGEELEVSKWRGHPVWAVKRVTNIAAVAPNALLKTSHPTEASHAD